MNKSTLLHAALLLALCCAVAGVVASYLLNDPLTTLERTYSPPSIETVPPGVVRANPQAKEYKNVQNFVRGEEIVLAELYLKGHKFGWTCAFDDFRHFGEFKVRKFDDCYEYYADCEMGYKGFWVGYNDARKKIEGNLPNF